MANINQNSQPDSPGFGGQIQRNRQFANNTGRIKLENGEKG
jgi:hypothetical protein